MSIGGDAVDAAEEYFRAGAPTGRSSIEQISWHYGAQAVVVSIDPRRVWVADPADCPHATVRSSRTGTALREKAALIPRSRRASSCNMHTPKSLCDSDSPPHDRLTAGF